TPRNPRETAPREVSRQRILSRVSDSWSHTPAKNIKRQRFIDFTCMPQKQRRAPLVAQQLERQSRSAFTALRVKWVFVGVAAACRSLPPLRARHPPQLDHRRV